MATTREIKKRYRDLLADLDKADADPVIKGILLEHTKRIDKATAELHDLVNRLGEGKAESVNEQIKKNLREQMVSFIGRHEAPIPYKLVARRYGTAARRYGGILTFVQSIDELTYIDSSAGKAWVCLRSIWDALSPEMQELYQFTERERNLKRERRELAAEYDRQQKREERDRIKLAEAQARGLPFDPEDYDSEEAWIKKRRDELAAEGLNEYTIMSQSLREADEIREAYFASKKGVAK